MAKTKRITSETIRENAKRDLSPKWDGFEKWSGEQFTAHFREAMNYYNLNFKAKDLRPKVIDWMTKNDYTDEQLTQFKNTKVWRCSLTLGATAACLIKGMPESHKGFNNDRSMVDWMREQIDKVITEGVNDRGIVDDSDEDTPAIKVINIQDRLREHSGKMCEEIDYIIDRWISNPDEFDPKEFKLVNLLRGKGAKAVHARLIKGFYQKDYDELIELASGKADDQLREAYQRYSRKNVRKMIEFYELLQSACDQLSAESKVLRKSRTKKAKPVEVVVKNLKYKISDDKLGIASVPPTSIVGAQLAVIYNTKTRKIGMYHSINSEGLNVKGSKIINFTEKSVQKTLRKPEVQIKDFKEQNTQKRVETWFDKIKSIDTKMNGRINPETIILKVFK